jgi:hypothetical protein
MGGHRAASNYSGFKTGGWKTGAPTGPPGTRKPRVWKPVRCPLCQAVKRYRPSPLRADLCQDCWLQMSAAYPRPTLPSGRLEALIEYHEDVQDRVEQHHTELRRLVLACGTTPSRRASALQTLDRWDKLPEGARAHYGGLGVPYPRPVYWSGDLEAIQLHLRRIGAPSAEVVVEALAPPPPDAPVSKWTCCAPGCTRPVKNPAGCCSRTCTELVRHLRKA